MKKKILSLILAIVLTLALIPAFMTSAQAADTWQEAYISLLNNPGKANRFALVDMDGDSTPELLLFEQYQYSGAYLRNIYTFTTQIQSLPFPEMAFEFHRVPADSDRIGFFSDWMSANGRSGETFFLTLEGGQVKNTLVYSYALGDIGYGGTTEDEEHVYDPALYELYKKSSELTIHAITSANIKTYITDTAPSLNDTPASSSAHPFAAALSDYIKGANNPSSRYLANTNSDGIEVMIATRGEKTVEGGDEFRPHRIFYIYNGELRTYDYRLFYPDTIVFFSATNYLAAEIENDIGFWMYVVFDFSNGEVNPISLSHYYNKQGDSVLHSHDHVKVSESEYNDYLKKYGLDKFTTNNKPNPKNQTDEILNLTAAPSGIIVSPTASTVYVNGAKKDFEAYNIEGNNYFKLRDLAAALNGTAKQFEVSYNTGTKAITLTSGMSYTPVGGEMDKGDGNPKTALPTASKIYLDGNELDLTVYNINGNNFFKLRDLMLALNVYVGYDNTTKNITLDTARGYTA